MSFDGWNISGDKSWVSGERQNFPLLNKKSICLSEPGCVNAMFHVAGNRFLMLINVYRREGKLRSIRLGILRLILNFFPSSMMQLFRLFFFIRRNPTHQSSHRNFHHKGIYALQCFLSIFLFERSNWEISTCQQWRKRREVVRTLSFEFLLLRWNILMILCSQAQLRQNWINVKIIKIANEFLCFHLITT